MYGPPTKLGLKKKIREQFLGLLKKNIDLVYHYEIKVKKYSIIAINSTS